MKFNTKATMEGPFQVELDDPAMEGNTFKVAFFVTSS